MSSGTHASTHVIGHTWRVVRIAILACALLLGAPAAEALARKPAAVVTTPTVSWVRVVDVPAGGRAPAGRVLVRVRIDHRPVQQAAPGTVLTGTVTAILSRYRNGRDYAIAAQTASRVLPIRETALGVVYQMTLSAPQSRAVRDASRAGALRVLVSVDQRANAKRRAPATRGTFIAQSAKAGRLAGAVPLDPAPYFVRARGGQSAVIGADRRGRSSLDALTLALGDGRRLELARRVSVADDGTVALAGRPVRIVGADGSIVFEGPGPDGLTVVIGGTSRDVFTVRVPEWMPLEGVTIAAGETTLRAPKPRRAGR